MQEDIFVIQVLLIKKQFFFSPSDLQKLHQCRSLLPQLHQNVGQRERERERESERETDGLSETQRRKIERELV